MDELTRDNISKLSEEYLTQRNDQMRTKNRVVQMQLAIRRGELIEKRLVQLQAGFLLTGLRQRVLALHHTLPRQLEGKTSRETGEIIRKEAFSMLRDLAQWPSRMMDANWVEQIDADLLPASEEKPKTKGQRSRSHQSPPAR